ncbi:MAG: PP2C family serine/threonine-protein phosphatase [Pseudomonadota bacterium]
MDVKTVFLPQITEGISYSRFVGFCMERPEFFETSCGSLAVFLKKGTKKSRNEDSLMVAQLENRGMVLAVADGVGGHADGDQASKLAIDTLIEIIEREPFSDAKIRNLVLDAFEEGNERIIRSFQDAATTLMVAEIKDQAVRFYLAGDSLALISSSRGRLKYRVYGHNPVDFGILAGVWDESQYDPMGTRHMVTSVLGSEDMQVQVTSSLVLTPGDTLVLGSDGLFDNLSSREISKIIAHKNLDLAASQLQEKVASQMKSGDLEYSKEDDLSFILFRPST